VVVGFLPELGVEDMLFVELAGNILFVWFEKTAGDWLWCNGMTIVGLGCLDEFAGKMMDTDIAEVGWMPLLFLLAKDVNGTLQLY
jgi:hypothetical protein